MKVVSSKPLADDWKVGNSSICVCVCVANGGEIAGVCPKTRTGSRKT